MHAVEPFYRWRSLYIASEDENSPFYGRTYSEFSFENSIYNFLIHPQWDSIGSTTLFAKALFVDYHEEFCIIELIGEWNDTIENDVMTLKRDFIDFLIRDGISKFIMIGENVLNFHASDDCYYEEWFEDIEDGWIAFINFHDHVLQEMKSIGIDYFVATDGELNEIEWRKYLPSQFFKKVKSIMERRLN